jgi:hypothetical protein
VTQTPRQLVDLVASLSDEERAAVEAFIRYLHDQTPPSRVEVRAALDEFIRKHSDLLRRLSK